MLSDVDVITEMRWVKARSSQGIGMCIEVSNEGDRVFIRDSKEPTAGALQFSRGEFAAFLDGCRRGEFDFMA